LASPPDDREPTPRDAATDGASSSDSPPPDPSSSDPPSGRNPLISWAPSGTGPESSPTEGRSGAEESEAPVVGWDAPRDARPPAPIAGFVVANAPSRIVAYLADGILLGVANIVLVVIVSPVSGAAGGSDAIGVLIARVLALGLEFAYFVGFWTSRGRATPGMRLLRIQVIDARADQPLSTLPATVRWLMLSGAIGLIFLLPIDSQIFGLASLLWILVVLLSVLADPLRRGIHDQAAGSLVVQRIGVRSNAAAMGCLVLVVLFVVIPFIALILLGPEIDQILRDAGQST